MADYGKITDYFFQEFFASIGKIVILGGGTGIGWVLWGFETFLVSPNLLRS